MNYSLLLEWVEKHEKEVILLKEAKLFRYNGIRDLEIKAKFQKSSLSTKKAKYELLSKEYNISVEGVKKIING